MEASRKIRYLSRMFDRPRHRIVSAGRFARAAAERHPRGLTVNDPRAGGSIALLTASPFVGSPLSGFRYCLVRLGLGLEMLTRAPVAARDLAIATYIPLLETTLRIAERLSSAEISKQTIARNKTRK